MRRVAAAVLLIVGPVVFWEFAASPSQPEPSAAVYDPDPANIWNRLYDVLFVRTDGAGTRSGVDSLDPLLFGNTKHLLEPKSHRRVTAILDEFLQTHAENLSHDPLKRAILQRDVWAVFDWSAAREPERDDDPAYEREKRELQARLAEVLRRLALTPKQIESLPDNYAQALASGEFAKEYDPAHRDRAFLPPDLFDQHGPWVEMGSGPAQPVPAIEHVSSFSGRSRFLIFIRLPGGRKATYAYFHELWNFPQPWIVRSNAPLQTDVNPALPSFPAGTQVALVRQMTLFDNQGDLTPAPITESVQIRVYRDVSERNSVQDFGRPEAMTAGSGQDVYEIRLSRPRLFANQSGGLRAVGPDEKGFVLFNAEAHDEFDDPRFTMQWEHVPPISQTCVMCHRGAGIASLNSRANLLKPSFLQQDPTYELPPRWWENDGTLEWKQHRYDWGLLNGYWKAAQPR